MFKRAAAVPPRPFAFDHPIQHTPALWHPDRAVPREGFAVVLFRRAFELKRPMKRLTLWTSASQRFELYLDGKLIARGPSRSDPMRWGVVPVSIPQLAAGRHILAARVVHFGQYGGIGQMGGPGFFVVCPEGSDREIAEMLSTAVPWRVFHDRSREPITEHAWGKFGSYYVVGCGEKITGADVPWGWESVEYDDSTWPEAKVVCRGAADPWGNVPLGHILRPDPLPPMEERIDLLARVAECPDGLRPDAQKLLGGQGFLRIEPHAQVRLVLDRGELTNAYPILTLSGGNGSRIRIVSAEAPYHPDSRTKPPRDQTAGMVFRGHADEIIPDGSSNRAYTTLWFRSFRYLELLIETGDEPLALDDIQTLSTAYPLRRRAKFTADAAHRDLARTIRDVSWRTARLCAHETFFDCPHYEQAQFPGDTRVQAIYHYLIAADDTLARKAIDDFHASRLAEGLTQCRYPSTRLQILPTYSLYWIGMLHDFRVYRGDLDFLRPYLPAAREVLAWFERFRRADGLLGLIPYAPFMDWTGPFKCGNAPQDADGGSSILTLLLAEGCQWMARLESACGWPQLNGYWRGLSRSLVDATLARCWDEGRALLADTPARASFSQHAQIQAILAGAWPSSSARHIVARAMGDQAVTAPGTHYYRYYVMQALKRCGLGERFVALLDCWKRSLEGPGLSTWPESDGDPRSDCHAWSVTPDFELLQTVLGVEPDPAANGFARIRFSPNLGPMAEASGEIPTPHGRVQVQLKRRPAGAIDATLRSPVPVILPGRRSPLPAGLHRLRLDGKHPNAGGVLVHIVSAKQ